MTQRHMTILEIIFFIISFGLVLQDPAGLIAAGADYIHIISPVMTAMLLVSMVMVYACIIRIINEGKLLLNLFAGIVYFVNIVRWISLI